MEKLPGKKIFFESILLCIIGFGVGFVINRQVVTDSFNGSLVTAIKQQLQEEIAQKAGQSQSEDGRQAIVIIDAEKAKAWFDDGQDLFIDARPDYQYEAGHIAGSVNIIGNTLEDRLDELMDRASGGRLIVYCVGPECPEAVELADLMVEFDLKPVYVYTGGWEQWSQLGYPSETGKEL